MLDGPKPSSRGPGADRAWEKKKRSCSNINSFYASCDVVDKTAREILIKMRNQESATCAFEPHPGQSLQATPQLNVCRPHPRVKCSSKPGVKGNDPKPIRKATDTGPIRDPHSCPGRLPAS